MTSRLAPRALVPSRPGRLPLLGLVAFCFLFSFLLSVPAHAAGCILTENASVQPEDAAIEDLFGAAVAIDGDVALITSIWDDDNGSRSGSVYVYRRAPATGRWVEVQKLIASDGSAGDLFGFNLDVKGDLIVIGAPLKTIDGEDLQGAAYVFRCDPQTGLFLEVQRLTSSDGSFGDFFGTPAIGDGVIAVAAHLEEEGCPNTVCNQGAVYVFVQDEETLLWTEIQKLRGTGIDDPDLEPSFGSSLAIDGDTLVIGTRDSGGRETPERAYVYRRDPGSDLWLEDQILVASDGEQRDDFGYDVALSGDLLVVSAIDDGDAADFAGSAYVFRDVGGVFVEEQKVFGEPEERTSFGFDVAVDGETILIGNYEKGPGIRVGAAHLYRNDGDEWFLASVLKASDRESGDRFARGLALSGGTAVIGAADHDVPLRDVGIAYFFESLTGPPPDAGTVNLATGAASDVLLINGTAGGNERTVMVPSSSPLSFSLLESPSGSSAGRYVIWAWFADRRDCVPLRVAGQTLGITVLPTPLQGGSPQLLRCLRGQGMPGRVCRNVEVEDGPGFAPWSITLRNGIRGPLRVMTQGLLEDEGAANTLGFSTTNALTLLLE